VYEPRSRLRSVVVLYIANIHGDFNTGAETFQHSLAMNDSGTSSQSNLADTFVSDVAQSLTSSDFLSELAPVWRYTGISVAEVLSQNPVRLSAATRREFGTAMAGTSGNRTLPPQTAIAVSLTATPYSNGTPVRGRWYMPPTGGGLAVNTDGSIPVGIQDKVGAFAAALIGAVNLASDGRFAAVWSRLSAGKGDGEAHQITGIRVGNRFDTIRSRRKAIQETYKEYSFSSI
jgi:hypothetical protein